MADKNSPRRPVAGSRIPSRSPRRLAGQTSRPDPTPEPTVDRLDPEPTVDRLDPEATVPDDVPTEAPAPLGVLQRPRTTKVLGVLTAAAAVLLGGLLLLETQEPDADPAALWSPVSRADEFTLPTADQVPVTVGPLEWTSAIDEIAHSVTKVLSFNHETIDSQEELAAELVTAEFLASDLSKTIAETAPKLKENEAEYTVTVAGQSVISATPTKVRALLFVNQLVTKGAGEDAVSDNYPLRLDVEGVLVDDTWLISSLNAG